MRIHTNLGKTKSMACTPGFIWSQQEAVAYKRRATDEGANFWERNRTRLRFTDCVGSNGGFFASLSHGEISWYSPASYQGCVCSVRKFGDLCGVLPVYFEVIEIPCGGLSDKGKQPWEDSRALHVLPLEVKGGDCSGCPKDTNEV